MTIVLMIIHIIAAILFEVSAVLETNTLGEILYGICAIIWGLNCGFIIAGFVKRGNRK